MKRPISFGRVVNFARRMPAVLTQPERLYAQEAIKKIWPEASPKDIEQLRYEYYKNDDLFLDVDRLSLSKRRRRAQWEPWLEFQYMLVRMHKPEIYVETGVFDGISSAVILQAMEDNNKGRLVSIDLPATEPIKGATDHMLEGSLPPGVNPGWCVPQRLRTRYDLRLGDARELLPAALKELGKIDIFFHDSLHTYDHMIFEYRCAWPHLKDGGFVVSDDIFANPAMLHFSKEVGRKYLNIRNGFGCVRK